MASTSPTPSSTDPTPTITYRGYSHVNRPTLDLERSVQFYCDVMGFAPIPRPAFGAGAWLERGNIQVHLSVVDELPQNPFTSHIAFMIPADAYADTCAALEARGVEWMMKPEARMDFDTEVWSAFVQDPDGNPIELTTAGPRY